MTSSFYCQSCHAEKTHNDTFTTGYGRTSHGVKICFECCGKQDKKRLIDNGKGYLYLTEKDGKKIVGNWPGTLTIPVYSSKTGRHNIAGTRTDVWFMFGGKRWHGTQYGKWTQICHVKRVK